MASFGLVAMGGIARPARPDPSGLQYFEIGAGRGGPGAIPAAETIGYLGLVCLVTFSLGVEFACVTIPAQTIISEATTPHLRGGSSPSCS